METEKKEEKTFKDMLKNYREYGKKIAFYKMLIVDKEKEDYSIGGGIGDGQPGTPKKSYKTNTAEIQVANKVDTIAYYNKQIDLFKAKKEFVESMVNTLSFSYQGYIKNRFFLGYSIKQVANIANVDEDSMRVTLQSIKDKLEDKYKKMTQKSNFTV